MFSPSKCPGLYKHSRGLGGEDASALLLPIGSYEDRPSGLFVLDTLLSLSVACRASKWCGAQVLWPLGYGYSPLHRFWLGFSPVLLREIVGSLVREASRLGNILVVLDGHYGHKSIVEEAIREENAIYINLWDLLASVFKTFREQLAFEQSLSMYFESGGAGRGFIDRVLGMLARRVCGEIQSARRALQQSSRPSQ